MFFVVSPDVTPGYSFQAGRLGTRNAITKLLALRGSVNPRRFRAVRLLGVFVEYPMRSWGEYYYHPLAAGIRYAPLKIARRRRMALRRQLQLWIRELTLL